MNKKTLLDVGDRCPFGAMKNLQYNPILVANNNHAFRFANNSGSPSVLESEPEMKSIFTRVEPDAWFKYVNVNDRNDSGGKIRTIPMDVRL